MSWVTVIWSVLIGASAAIAIPYLFLGIWRRRAADLFFVLAVASVIAMATLELAMMRSTSVDQFATALEWAHLPVFLLLVAVVGFVHFYFGTGRLWLGIAACLVRFVCLIVNFVYPPNLNFREITGLQGIHFLGDTVSIPTGIVSPWTHVGELSSLLALAFVVDSLRGIWRRGKPEDRRLALVVGGSLIFFILVATTGTALIHLKIIRVPYHVSVPFVAVIVAMAFECYEMLHAAEMAQRVETTKASLRESETRFQIVADSAPVMIWMSGVDKLCDFFNKPWFEFTGRTIEQELGNGWAEGVHPDDLQRCLQTYTVAFDAREPFVMQYRLRRYDGEYRWIQDDGVPRYDARKNFTGYIGSCVDVTELISKDQALRESEERMSLALDEAHLGLWEWHVDRDELWGTQARRSLLGLPGSGKIKLEEALSRVHEGDRDKVRHTLMDAAKTGKDYSQEYRIVFADGSVRWTEHHGRCVRGADGKVVLLRGLSIDVTERKAAEQKFRLAVEASPSGILLVDHQGRIVLVNAHIEELFGYTRDELIGKPVEVLVPERFASGHSAYREKFLAAPEARAMGAGRELFARRKDGSEFPVEIGLNPIQMAGGLLILANVVDISARLAAEEQTRRNREQVELLGRVSLLGEMAASLAHELNQPLAAIMNNASAVMQYIEQDRLDAEQLQEILTDVMADGRRAFNIVRDVRTAIKKGTAIRGRINLNDLVKSVARMLQPDAAANFCKMEMSLAPDLPAIEGDPTQIQQVLINLVSNAFDAMDETPASRRIVQITTSSNGDGTISVAVRDHGCGIADAARERLFEHFYTTKKEGLGMGLAIVRSIIEAHGGTIAAENAPGGGAHFHFRLPTKKETPQ